MSNTIRQRLVLFLGLTLLVTGCNAPVDPKPNSSPPIPDDIPGQQVDINGYRATTPEAQKIIDGIKQGQRLTSGVVNGGYTDEMIKERAGQKQQQLTALLRGTSASDSVARSGQPPSIPTTAATRPKISWVGKRSGYGETYLVNDTNYDEGGAYPPYSVMYERCTWYGYGTDQIWYFAVLLQTSGINSSFVQYRDYNGNYFNYKVLSIDYPKPVSDSNYIRIVYDYPTLSNDYIYSGVPADVFEDPYGYPIRETWHWSPPWHFEKLSLNLSYTGRLTYNAVAREGSETQTLIRRYDIRDFFMTYIGQGGWQSQGWRVKDFDVTDGIISAILYVPSVPYDEVSVWYVTDEYFNYLIGKYIWPAGFRGFIIDNSW